MSAKIAMTEDQLGQDTQVRLADVGHQNRFIETAQVMGESWAREQTLAGDIAL